MYVCPSVFSSHHSYRGGCADMQIGHDPLSLPDRMPAQVLLALLQIRVPQGARERAKHTSAMTCTPGCRCKRR
jgi:hypothetical protein